MLDGDGDDLIVVHDTGVVLAGGICPVRTCLVWPELRLKPHYFALYLTEKFFIPGAFPRNTLPGGYSNAAVVPSLCQCLCLSVTL